MSSNSSTTFLKFISSQNRSRNKTHLQNDLVFLVQRTHRIQAHYRPFTYMPAAWLQNISSSCSCRSCSQTTYMAIDYLGLQHRLWVYYNWECVMCNCCSCVSAEFNSHFMVCPVGVQQHGELSCVWCSARYYWLWNLLLLPPRLQNDNYSDCTIRVQLDWRQKWSKYIEIERRNISTTAMLCGHT